MTARYDGGPAFPQFDVVSGERDGHGDLIEPFTSASGGMSRRDWFAGQVLPAVFASAVRHNDGTGSTWPVTISEVAEKSFAVADAMLAASEKEGR
ncbi:hypothetical protein Ga0061061_1168 [Chelatococcus sambhunathii]|uniref:Uncharacterized protein n=1 Tax=Chelatococcus sambhunathii TaxID=363953 RepID=A0ABP2ADM1_9HYPH|nr:hypothetical protein [Chelatococcus sambhunathii]CUA90843.1 hypothetical protein Ga0061061_1168 [Chelatococcus sambhunathii]